MKHNKNTNLEHEKHRKNKTFKHYDINRSED